jgi:hypothetical protein
LGAAYPVVVHGAGAYMILFQEDMEHPGILWMAQVDEDGGVSISPMPLPADAVPGGAAATFSGTEYAIISESVGTIQFILLDPDGGGGSGRDLEGFLVSTTGPISEPLGMLDMVWTGSRYGVVWTHENPTTGSHVWFFELDRGGEPVNGPHMLNPDATESFNPSITWVETDTQRYYVFAWNEFTSTYGWHVLYTYSYGCTM